MSANKALAADLQIEDHKRLIRVLADVTTPQKVVIKLSAEPTYLSIENLDGLQQNIEAKQVSSQQYEFLSVTPGVWRIKLKPRELTIQSVQIKSIKSN